MRLAAVDFSVSLAVRADSALDSLDKPEYYPFLFLPGVIANRAFQTILGPFPVFFRYFRFSHSIDLPLQNLLTEYSNWY